MGTQDTTPPAQPFDANEQQIDEEPMTAAQCAYLEALCSHTGNTLDKGLTKAEASKLIEELRKRVPRSPEGYAG